MLILDGSQQRAIDLDIRIVRYAERNYGMHLSADDQGVLTRAEMENEELVSCLDPDDCEALREIADDAVTHLNERTSCGDWYVEDSSLWCDLSEESAEAWSRHGNA